jgi:uncharacterized protein YjbJ (UPF0337 family)
MNWDRIEGKWTEVKGKVRERWGKLTNDDLDRIAGKRDQLIGKLQERYGWARDQVDRELKEFERTFEDAGAEHPARSAAPRQPDGRPGEVEGEQAGRAPQRAGQEGHTDAERARRRA